MWTHLSRQKVGGGGKGGFLKGEGERQIELDRRILRERITRLSRELDEVKKTRSVQRAARIKRGIPTFAIVGYTNAGKSTLLNKLTNAGVFVEDKLFATLDTTTRKYTLANNKEILLIDTVGFIRKLPHGLIASFKSTLEEALSADILIHLIDSTSPSAEDEAEATYEVLRELKADKKPIITVLNKIDEGSAAELRYKLPNVVEISALKQIGFEELLSRIERELSKLSKRVKLKIDQKNYSYIGELMKKAHVISQEYVGNDIILDVEIPRVLLHKFKQFLV